MRYQSFVEQIEDFHRMESGTQTRTKFWARPWRFFTEPEDSVEADPWIAGGLPSAAPAPRSEDLHYCTVIGRGRDQCGSRQVGWTEAPASWVQPASVCEHLESASLATGCRYQDGRIQPSCILQCAGC